MATITAAAAGGNWSATTTWTGGVVPSAADDVKLASTSGPVTIDANSVCRSLDCTGYISTLAITATFTLSIGDATAGAGSVALKLVTGMTFSGGSSNAIIAFVSTSATQQTITTAGKSIGAMSFTTAGNWQLTDALTIGSGGTLTHTGGTLNTNGQTLSIGLFAGNSALVRTLTLGASTVTLTGTAGTVWNWSSNTTNLTFNCGTSTIKNSAANVTLQFAGMTYNNIDVTVSTVTIAGAFTCANFTCQPAAGTGAMIIVSSGFTCTGTLTLKCTDSGTNGARGYFTPATVTTGVSTRTIILSSAPVLQNFDFVDIVLTGSGAPYSGTNLGDGQGNSGITFPATRTLYWVGTVGTWTTLNRWATASGNSDSSIGSVHIPMAHDNVVFDAASAITAGGTMGSTRVFGKNIDMSAANATFTWSLGLSPSVAFGNVSLKAGMTIGSSGQLALCGRGTQTLTTNGVSFGATGGINFAAVGGSYTLQDDLNVSAGSTTVYSVGGLDLNNKNVNSPGFSATATSVRTLTMGSGTMTLSGTSTVISVSDVNLTYNAGTGTIVIADTSATAKTVNLPNGKTVNAVTIAGGTGAVTMQWAGSTAAHFGTINTFNVTAPATVTYQASQTTTIGSAYNVTGSAGNLVTIQSSTSGTAFTLSKASGIVSSDYLSLKDSTATGSASWYAGNNSTNVSGNTGWFFTAPVSGGVMAFFR